MNTAVEVISTLLNMNNIYQKQMDMNMHKIKSDIRKVEAASSSAKTKSYLQSSVDGNGMGFDAYIWFYL